MLRLVHPAAREGQDPPSRRRKGHKPDALSLTTEEQRRVRAALRNAARAYGGLDVLAVVLAVPVETLYRISVPSRGISGTFAIRLARAAGVSVEALLSGTVADASRCPTCGARIQIGGAR
jgi:hypothetical protein